MRGFSLMELMIVLVVAGLILGFGLPSYHHYMESQALVGTSQNLVQSVQLQRSRAMATGQTVTMNFDTTGGRWFTLQGSKSNRYVLPRGVRFARANPASIQFTRDGHVNTSAIVAFRNTHGATDTVSILVSGLALVR